MARDKYLAAIASITDDDVIEKLWGAYTLRGGIKVMLDGEPSRLYVESLKELGENRVTFEIAFRTVGKPVERMLYHEHDICRWIDNVSVG